MQNAEGISDLKEFEGNGGPITGNLPFPSLRSPFEYNVEPHL